MWSQKMTELEDLTVEELQDGYDGVNLAILKIEAGNERYTQDPTLMKSVRLLRQRRSEIADVMARKLRDASHA
jgi:hypothetical protein